MCSHGPIFRRIGTDVPLGVRMKDDRENRVNDPSEGSRGGALRRGGRTARAEGVPARGTRTGVYGPHARRQFDIDGPIRRQTRRRSIPGGRMPNMGSNIVQMTTFGGRINGRTGPYGGRGRAWAAIPRVMRDISLNRISMDL